MKKLLFIITMILCSFAKGQSFFASPSGSGITETAVELGTVFTTSSPAKINAIRFYKWKNDAALYTLRLYQNGSVVATTTYSATATGWVSASITPFTATPGNTYVTSYYSPSGYYQAVNTYAFPVKAGPLTATKSVYKYGTLGSTVPSTTFQTANYFADVVYSVDQPAQVVHDTIRIHDTIQVPVLCPDTTWIFLDAKDSALMSNFPDTKPYGIFEFTLPGNVHVRFFREIQLYWRRQELQADGTWKEK